MIEPQIVALIAAALNAWWPLLAVLAGVVVALALVRFAMKAIWVALNGEQVQTVARDFSILEYFARDDVPPARTPPPRLGLFASMARDLRALARALAAHVRGDPVNPWWRVSWHGLDKAFTRANWVLFFAWFFLAFVCAALVSAGAPFELVAGVYLVVGVVWAQMLITITLSLELGRVMGSLILMLAEVGGAIGFALVQGVVVIGGLIFALRRGRLLAYLYTLEDAHADGKPIWAARIVQQPEALERYAVKLAEREAHEVARKARRAERKAERKARRDAWPLWRTLADRAALVIILTIYALMIVGFVLFDSATGFLFARALLVLAGVSGALLAVGWFSIQGLNRLAANEYQHYQRQVTA